MAKDTKSYAVSFVVNIHGSKSSKKKMEKLAERLVDELQASFDAEMVSGITGDCTFNVDSLVKPGLGLSGKEMTWQELEESIGGQMDRLDQPTYPGDALPIRMSDGSPLTGARVVRRAIGSGWEVWLSDAERL
jgi:hypothetical protein